MAESTLENGTKQDLVITRVFDAPVRQVWNAWIDPVIIRQWWGPEGFTCPSADMDVREGGTSLVCMRAPKSFGGQDMYSTWEYRSIVPMERIEFIHNLADKDRNKVDPLIMGLPPDFPRDQRQAVSFRDLGDGRTELTVTEYDWTAGQMMEMGRVGMEQSLDKMAIALKRNDPAPSGDRADSVPLPAMKLELVPMPVTDIDRAKEFYTGKVGFRVDHDVTPGNGMRVVQLTPPGSACSIVMGTGLGEISSIEPGSIRGLHLVVDDIAESRQVLVDRGVTMGEIMDMGGILFARFADPDGNSWLLQEIPARFRKGN